VEQPNVERQGKVGHLDDRDLTPHYGHADAARGRRFNSVPPILLSRLLFRVLISTES
jgi:hypothetical protein